MSNLLTIVLGGLTLPDQVELIETPTPNAIDVRTLGGDLYTDFINYYRSWTAAFDALDSDTWNAIMALYKSQYENETYLLLDVAALDLSTTVKLDISPAYYQWNGSQVGDGTSSNYPTLTLTEAFAVS